MRVANARSSRSSSAGNAASDDGGSSSYPLLRGTACLSCRKRKMKCDAGKPVCQQCQKANRAHDCEYDDGKSKSRTQVMQEKILKQEARIRELELTAAGASSGMPFVPTSPFPHSHPPSAPSPGFFDDAGRGTYSATPSPGMFTLVAPPAQNTGASPPFASGSNTTTSASPASGPWMDGFDYAHLVDPTTQQPPADDVFAWNGPGQNEPVPSWESEDIPMRTRQMLLDIFLKHREQCALVLHVERFRQNTQLPLGAPRRPHAALLNAMYLLAAKFSANVTLRAFEPRFFARAVDAVNAALERSDRLVDVVRAECLLAFYLYSNGRLLEGYYHASAAARLAIGLGLHQITSADPSVTRGPHKGAQVWSSSSADVLPPAADSVELGERIHAFWMAFGVDRAWSVATGMPPAFSDGGHARTRIETVWPRALVDYETGQASEAAYSSLRDLFAEQHPQPPSSDASAALRSKAITLFERASRLSSGLTTDRGISEDFWIEYRSIEYAIHRFSQSLPTVRATTDDAGGVDHTLALVHTLVYVATIHLTHPFVSVDTTSREKCLVAAGGALSVLRDLGEADARALDPLLGTAWLCVADVLVRESAQLKGVPGAESQATAIGMQLLAVVGAMKQLAEVFPVVGFQVSKVQGARSLA